MRLSWIVAVGLASLIAGSAFGQKQPEYLIIDNESAESIQVFVKTQIPPTVAWGLPTTVEAGGSAKILLGPDGSGNEPFDIDIRYDIIDNSGTDLVFSSVHLCRMMRECAKTGQQDWKLPTARAYTYIRLPDGRHAYQTAEKTTDLRAKADANTIRIPFHLVGKKVDYPNPPDPKPKPPPTPPKPPGT